MRATISFETDLDKVEETMGSLVSQESHTLRVAANILSNADRTTLLEEVSEALDLVQQATSQLQQYQQMLVGFERARFETLIPQDASLTLPDESGESTGNSPPLGELVRSMRDVKNAVKSMGDFDKFIEKISDREDRDSDESEPEEG